MSETFYSEYVAERKPHERAHGLINKWHARMFKRASKDLRINGKIRILEVGAGHGQLAEYVRSEGHDYNFIDLSQAVTNEMNQKGFVGTCCDLADAPASMRSYDVVWISHVLEHCETPSQAASLLCNAAARLVDAGALVVISPDASSYKWDFFASDWSHGYPTARRNVVQLVKESGLELCAARLHRGGFFSWFLRAPFAIVAKLPTFPVDVLLSRRRVSQGEGFFYSWKTILGWRQIYVAATLRRSRA